MSTYNVKNFKFVLALLSFIAIVVLLTLIIQSTVGASWMCILAPQKFSWMLANPRPVISTVTRKAQFPFFISSKNKKETLSLNFQEKLYQDSKISLAFTTFIKKKTGNFSSIADYLDSVSKYLDDFRSPMITENPDQHSWTETEEDKTERLSSSENSATNKKHIVWYNAPQYIRNRFPDQVFSRCPVKDCVISYNYRADHSMADAVIFWVAPGKVVPPRDHAKQVYIFFTMESPFYTSDKYSRTPWNKAFNWTWNFRADSDIFNPVGYLKRSPSVPSLTSLLKLRRHKVKPVAWFSSHCNAQSNRDNYVRKLRTVIPVDVYGHCGTLTCDKTDRKCITKLNDYLFYLSFENSMCVDYITEKYYKTFTEGVHVVPVVRGGANYSRFFPAGTFIDAEAFSGPEALGRHLLDLARDEAAYVDLLWRKAHFVYHEHGTVDAFCKLCYKLHHVDRHRHSYSNMYGWYHSHGCSRPRPFH